MLPTRRELVKLAAETGFAAPNLEKVTRLGVTTRCLAPARWLRAFA